MEKNQQEQTLQQPKKEKEPKMNYDWDKRQQKMIITEERTTEINDVTNKKGGGKSTTKVIVTYNKDAAIAIRNNMQQQMKNMGKFVKDIDRLKELAKNKEKLPYYKEIKDVLGVINVMNDQRMLQQYAQTKPQYERVKKELEEINKVLPV